MIVRTDIYIVLCASLDPGCVILSREALAFVGRYLSEIPIRTRRLEIKGRDGLRGDMIPLGEVILCADDDTRDGAHAAEVDDLVVNDLDHIEGFP